eukprot:COSAG01_NODE_1846_length_9050_cov_10.563991_3_plen_70_part_00
MAGADGQLKLTLEVLDINFGDGSNGVDINIKAYGALSLTIAGYSISLPGLSLEKKISNVVDLDAVASGL